MNRITTNKPDKELPLTVTPHQKPLSVREYFILPLHTLDMYRLCTLELSDLPACK